MDGLLRVFILSVSVLVLVAHGGQLYNSWTIPADSASAHVIAPPVSGSPRSEQGRPAHADPTPVTDPVPVNVEQIPGALSSSDVLPPPTVSAIADQPALTGDLHPTGTAAIAKYDADAKDLETDGTAPIDIAPELEGDLTPTGVKTIEQETEEPQKDLAPSGIAALPIKTSADAPLPTIQLAPLSVVVEKFPLAYSTVSGTEELPGQPQDPAHDQKLIAIEPVQR